MNEFSQKVRERIHSAIAIKERPTPKKKSKSKIKGYVYFFQYEENGPIKIGRSIQWEERLKEVQLYCPYDVKVLAILESVDIAYVETTFHKYLAKHRMQGEWFAPHTDVLEVIKHINDKNPEKIAEMINSI